MKPKRNPNTMNKSVLFAFCIIIMASCSDKEDPIGKWDDNIKLSARYAEFSSESDSITLKTKGDWWWINGISFENSTYVYFDRDDINLESESYSIKEESFVVERRDKNTLFVKLYDNNTAKERVMTISLEAGDYFDYVTIKQSSN